MAEGTPRKKKRFIDPIYLCLCGITVHNAMWFVSLVGIILSIASIVASYLTNNWSELALSLAGMITYVLVFFARKTHKPWMYLPLVVFHTAAQIFSLGIALLKLLIFCKVLNKKEFAWVEALWFNLDPTWMTVIFCSLSLIEALVQMWFVTLVWRAYKYMKNVVLKKASFIHDKIVTISHAVHHHKSHTK